ncbi:MAG: methyltransferase [Rhabdochlamydiaceae bacterium]|nr:methyltransferase [Rhabdochlamydiaceae bacterium]
MSFSCAVFPRCSGCSFQKDVTSPKIWEKIVEVLGVSELICDDLTSWRSRAKLAVRGSVDKPLIGLFEEGSHTVVDLKHCPLHYPVMNEALEKIRRLMKIHKIEPYREKEHVGRLRYLQMVSDRKQIQLSLVWNGEFLEEKEKAFVKQLYNEGMFHSIWSNYHPKRSNTILGNLWELEVGKEDFFQEISGISFAFHPSCFAQAHLSLYEKMLEYIDSLIAEGRSLIDLYSGVGCIGLSLAKKAKKVTLVESSPHAKSSFEKSLEKLPESVKKKCLFLSNPVEEVDFSEGDLILVDPPRKGLSKECKKKIFVSQAKQLIYISCGPESFLRDYREILQEGWILQEFKGFLLFPGTDHVEIVASFSR